MVSGKQLPLIKDNIVIVLEGKIQALRFTSDGLNIYIQHHDNCNYHHYYYYFTIKDI